jgi:hypothetical protein
MDQNIIKSLREALSLLKSGDAKSARSLLVDVLKNDPDNDQAWYMLSFAVPNQERQIYALNQVLRINPWHEKALTRFEKISGESYQRGGRLLEREGAIAPTPTSSVKPEPQEDLLTQRLIVSSDEADEEPVMADEPSPLVVEDDGESKEKFDAVDRKKKKIKKPRRQIIGPLLARIPRRTLILITLVAIVGMISFLIFRGNINLGGPVGTDQLIADQTQTPTSTHIPELTPTERGGGLPPTWTPSSPGGDTQIKLPSISTPSPELVSEISSVQREVFSERFDRVVEVASFLIPSADFNQILREFLSFPGYHEYVNQRELTYRALGLAKSWDDLSNFSPNLWADPYGVLYLPDVKSIIVQAEDFEIVEKYLYVRGYAQVLLADKYSFDSLGIYPICLQTLQRCQAILALIKGDAILQANQWLETYGPQSQVWKVNALEPNYYNLPMGSPPPFIEQELEFPHSKGKEFTTSLYNSGGWDLVNSAYLEIPTTEQILHPDKFLSGEEAAEIDDPPLSIGLDDNWTEVINESIGEWITYLLLAFSAEPASQIPTDTAQRAASGWGGDQTQIYHNSRTNQFVVSIHWAWDTIKDANQFYDALVDYIPLRFLGTEKVDHQTAECWQSTSESICVITSSGEVTWLSAPDMDIMDSIISLYSPGS